MARRLLTLLAGLALASCSQGQPAAPAADPARNAARAAITDYANLLMVERRPEDAFGKYFGELLIQHDPWIADGGKGDVEFLKARREAEPEQYAATERYVNVVHNILADREFVVLKSHVFTSATDSGRVFVDIWRIDDGKFVEHWDVVQPMDDGSAATVGCGVGATYEAARKAGNTVADPACGEPDPAADSAASEKVVRDYLASRPDSAKIERVIADGDFVLVHGFVSGTPRGTARVDLFRVRDGQIADKWAVVQPIPEFSASGRSMTGGPDDPLEAGRTRRAPKSGE